MLTKKLQKAVSFIVAFALLLSGIAGITFPIVKADTFADILDVAKTYVALNQNEVTLDGLLTAVKKIKPEITLASNDFYIKHAVPGVKDVMADGSANEYPLNIEGSDGAVVAIFEYNGNRYPFVYAFEHKIETIKINEVAILGTSSGFTYSGNGDATAYTGTADKIVIPANYNGSIAKFSNLSTVQQVKVVIVNNKVYLRDNAFENWGGLVAFQMAETTYDTAWNVFANPNDIDAQFQNCSNLKYVKLPDWIDTPSWAIPAFAGYVFNGCLKLENIKIPQVRKIAGSEDASKTTPINYATLSANNVREYIFPAKYTDTNGWIGGLVTTTGTRNLHWYNDNMTFVRAVALAAAAVNRLSINEVESSFIDTAKLAITGSADSESFRNSLSYSFKENASDTEVTKTLEISNGNDEFAISISGSYTLSNLSVTDYDISPEFDSSVMEYNLSVPYSTGWVAVEAIPVQGATVGEITGNMNLAVGMNTITIPVTTVNSKTVNYIINVEREDVNPIDEAFVVAKNFVIKKGNAITAQELLEVVQEIVPEATLDVDNDFYVKHAVNGVKDNTTDYPLNIEGSDGAVAAVFGYKGKRYGFSASFAHKTEVIEIAQTAVVGQSSGFTYDSNGNVISYTGTADKIVFPAGYAGTMTNLADKTSVKNVKVLIYNNGIAFLSKAFNQWEGLVAVQIDNGNTSMMLASAANMVREDHMFSECGNLKYFQFPKKINNGFYWNAMFPNSFLENCPKLETVVMPQEATSGQYTIYGYHVFYGSAVRDAVWPSYGASVIDNGDCFGASAVVNGTRNIHNFSDKMTFVRAAASVAVYLNSVDTSLNKEELITKAKEAVVGSSDSETFAEKIDYKYKKTNSDAVTVKQITLSYANDKIPVTVIDSNGISSLEVEGYSLEPLFDASVLNYSLTVPYKVNKVNVNAVAVNGATVGTISGNSGLSVGENTVLIPVTTTKDKLVTYSITINRESPPDADYLVVIDAARTYVINNKNSVTPEGLLAAVKDAVPTVTLDIENDFYIKHAVNGVKDNTTDYPLEIKGSDGAVAAVFENNGKCYGFTCAFPHSVETIEITETAVVGTSSGFTYDASGNVTGYSGTADKIVFPAGYNGTMLPIEDKEKINNIKVLIYNNGVSFVSRAFNDWDGLIAVQLDSGSTSMMLASAVNMIREDHMFSGCDNLKYFQFPQKINNGFYWNAMFPNSFLASCPKLETVIMPQEATSGDYFTYGYQVFYGSAIRDAVWPSYGKTVTDDGECFGASKVIDGTRNIHDYTDSMNFVRAAALSAAAVNELGIDATSGVALDTAKNAVKGSKDASTFVDSLAFAVEDQWEVTDYSVSGTLAVSDGRDTLPLYFSAGKALKFLDVGFALTPAFAPDVTDYTVNVGSRDSNLNIVATLADGASLQGISGNEELQFGVPQVITITVVTAQNKTVNYTVTATRQSPTELNDSLISKIKAYAQLFTADNYCTEEKYTAYLSNYKQDLDITVKPLNFYKYNSVPGATEGSEILVPGHNGYLSSEVEITNGKDTIKTVIMTTIKPYMKNYVFSSDEISKTEDFQLSKDGKTLEWYSGDAKKIVIPNGVTSIALGWYSGENMEDVKVIIVPDSVEELPDSFCYNMTGLEAVYLGNNIITIPGSAFSRCYYLQFIHLPEELVEIGGSAFKFAMSIPEMYFPSSVESLGSNSFWTCGIRNYNLPKNLITVSSYGICYPQANGGIWQENTQSDEMKADLTNLMTSYQFNKNNVIITAFGTNLTLGGTTSFAASDYQGMGAQVHVRAPSSFETTVFEGKLNGYNIYKYFDDMTMSEIAARAQVALDHVLLLKTATEQQVETAVTDSYYTNTEKTLNWVEAYTVNDGVATGIIKLTSGDTAVNLTLNREIYTPPVSSGGSILKGDKSDIKLDINFDESLFDDFEGFDEEDTTDSNVNFDSFDDKDDAVVETDKGEATVEIRINKVSDKQLGKKIVAKLDGYSYVAFDLSLYSEQTVQLNGKLGIAVPLPEGFDGDLCSIYYITEDGKFVDMGAKKYGKDMTFYTTALGRYVLVMDIIDYTPINIAVGIGGGVLLVGIASLVVLLIISKKKRSK